jgi:hypothetical protein
MTSVKLPGFTADFSLHSMSGQHQIVRQILLSGGLINQIYPARLKDENEGVNCDTCVGAQCAELHCLEHSIDLGGTFDPGGGGGGGGGGVEEPCLSSHQCSACVPTGPSIFSPGRQFCIDSICSPGFGGRCDCQVFKGFRSCRVPRPVFTAGRR